MTRNFAVWGGGVADPKAADRKMHIIKSIIDFLFSRTCKSHFEITSSIITKTTFSCSTI